MPELPEVETTRRGIAPAIKAKRVEQVIVREHRLRWPLSVDFASQLTSQQVVDVHRRAKYLLLQLDRGTLIVHLGMSGSLRVLPMTTPVVAHDHVDIVFDSGACLRFNDPRRFGSMHWTTDNPLEHPLLKRLAPEPLGNEFNAEYLAQKSRRRKVAIKLLLMNSNLVVGVGNIYASEALFRAGIRPTRAAGKVKAAEFVKLVRAVKGVLHDAIRSGGTTLRDYVNADGMPGYFRQKLFVYERAGEPCRTCKKLIKQITQGQRSTYYCPKCQA
ncbi:MAG: bifunctional DNA-formamidopyrimidine glycosylase/DNA-(apurinic or apyrimidinic site) lyase [Candidatus Obscuribacterales bacterium]|nr:bifunctional DNA-formamidopyrimidine glycosylase/DNA-(apurinic or apyrimidinic site) lyase [Steroidobacteraceae bacterium]